MNFKAPLAVLALLLICELNQASPSHPEVSDDPKDLRETSAIKDEKGLPNRNNFQESPEERDIRLKGPKPSRSIGLSCLTKRGFRQAVKALGLTKLPGVKLVKITKTMVNYLKKHKEITVPQNPKCNKKGPHYGHNGKKSKPKSKKIFGKKNKQRAQLADEEMKQKMRNSQDGDAAAADDDDDDDDEHVEDESHVQKRAEHPICPDILKLKFILADERQNLAYKIETRVCEGAACRSKLFIHAYDTSLGRCGIVQSTLIIYVMDRNRNLVSRGVTIGSACKCSSPYP